MWALVLALAIVADPSIDYARGYCDGRHQAHVHNLEQRDHWRALLQVTPKAFPARQDPIRKSFTAFWSLQYLNDTIQWVADSADWFLVLPAGRGPTFYRQEDGSEVWCGIATPVVVPPKQEEP